MMLAPCFGWPQGWCVKYVLYVQKEHVNARREVSWSHYHFLKEKHCNVFLTSFHQTLEKCQGKVSLGDKQQENGRARLWTLQSGVMFISFHKTIPGFVKSECTGCQNPTSLLVSWIQHSAWCDLFPHSSTSKSLCIPVAVLERGYFWMTKYENSFHLVTKASSSYSSTSMWTYREVSCTWSKVTLYKGEEWCVQSLASTRQHPALLFACIWHLCPKNNSQMQAYNLVHR